MVFIGVIGGSSVARKIYNIAYETGREIARRGGAVVCGGLTGVMEAACKGAKSRGGLTVGILPGRDRERANKFVDIAVPTGLGLARNLIIVNMAEGLVAIDGKEGTLSEIAFSLKSKKPVAGIETFDIKGVIKKETAVAAVGSIYNMIRQRKGG